VTKVKSGILGENYPVIGKVEQLAFSCKMYLKISVFMQTISGKYQRQARYILSANTDIAG
jgi:hypothetical protein